MFLSKYRWHFFVLIEISMAFFRTYLTVISMGFTVLMMVFVLMTGICVQGLKKEGFESKSNPNAQQAVVCLEQEVTSICARTTNSAACSMRYNSSSSSSLLDFVDIRVTEKAKTSRSDAIVVLRQYYERANIKTSVDPLLFWKIAGDEFNAIKDCVHKYVCILATSVESECIFSKCGRLITDRRTRLKANNVNMLIFCNANQWLK